MQHFKLCHKGHVRKKIILSVILLFKATLFFFHNFTHKCNIENIRLIDDVFINKL